MCGRGKSSPMYPSPSLQRPALLAQPWRSWAPECPHLPLVISLLEASCPLVLPPPCQGKWEKVWLPTRWTVTPCWDDYLDSTVYFVLGFQDFFSLLNKAGLKGWGLVIKSQTLLGQSVTESLSKVQFLGRLI